MIGFVLLAVMGTAAIGAGIFDLFDDGNDDDNSASNDSGAGGDQGQVLSYEDTDSLGLLSGADGDDTLSGGQDPDLAPGTIDLMAGDDTAVVEHPFGIQVLGGEGDDTLSSTSVGNTLIGGAGNDTLTGIDANDMDGGAGDDVITFDSDVELNDNVAIIDGGTGDDTITVLADAGVDSLDRGGAIITGGEGSDQFDIKLDLLASQNSISEDDGLLETGTARIADFNPDEDAITIEVIRNAETAGRDLSAIGFDQTEVDGVFTTEISMQFEATDTATEAVSYLTIVSSAAFTVDDIGFVNAYVT
ncbi:MAG: hypothetical protein COC12_04925 [Rhodobacteraceae bacterium]|nr:MAG: hypothetical protein COC12_04925 [Paracoccaceae bacterium]